MVIKIKNAVETFGRALVNAMIISGESRTQQVSRWYV
tara:strand:+ start:178 stop:288 length:111 start_codon:yes stop_codon:yes gene_type:complete